MRPLARRQALGTGAGLYGGLAGHLAIPGVVHRASGRDDLGAAAARGTRAPRCRRRRDGGAKLAD